MLYHLVLIRPHFIAWTRTVSVHGGTFLISRSLNCLHFIIRLPANYYLNEHLTV